MEKIMNMQMPVQVKADAKQIQKADPEPSKGFDKLLKQQKETPKQEDVKKTDSQPKGSETQKESPKADTEQAQELAEQLAAQLAAEQMAAQPVVTQWEPASVQEAPVVAVAEAVASTALEEASTEAVPAKGQKVQTKEEKPLETVEPVPVEPVQEQSAVRQAEKPREFAGDAPGRQQKSAGDTPVKTEEPTIRMEAVQGRKDSEPQEEQDARTEPEPVHGVRAEQPMDRTDTLHSAAKNEEPVLKATMEELPQELGKALSTGKMTGIRTLTVELEPASLGKLTIKVAYEAGRAAVSVIASNPKTLELLNEKATEIAAILKERTGEETVIYTHQPEREPGQESQNQGQNGREGREQGQQRREETREQSESFAQQLRLGLV